MSTSAMNRVTKKELEVVKARVQYLELGILAMHRQIQHLFLKERSRDLRYVLEEMVLQGLVEDTPENKGMDTSGDLPLFRES